MPRSFPGWAGLFPLALLLSSGCGESGPRVVQVSGTVRHGGQPVPKLVVNFVPAEGRPSWGVTDQDGHYKLKYTREREGAVTGTHKVWVEVRPASPKEEMDFRDGRASLHPAMQDILAKYGDRSNPMLTVEVKEDNQVIDLALN